MTVYKKVKEIPDQQAAYLAGIIDGEGTITLSRRNVWRPRHIALTVSNCELSLLEYILKLIGVGKITSKVSYKINHSPAYTYQIYNRQALDVIKIIVPFLRTYKKRRAELALKEYIKLTPRNGKYSPALWEKREKFVERFLSIRPHSTKTP